MKRIIGLFILTCFLVIPVNAQSAEQLFQQALRMERSSGDYAAAIRLYEQVTAAPNVERRLTARALIQIGRAYENLGRQEAEIAYNRVISEFADLVDLAAEAQAGIRRVSADNARQSSTEKQPFSTTKVNLYEDLAAWGSALSPSGRFFATVAKDGSVVHVNLETDERRTLVQNGNSQYVHYSPDETEIAYGWWDEDDETFIKIVNLESGAIRTALNVRDYFARRQNLIVAESDPYVMDWTKDGSALLVSIMINKAIYANRDDADYSWESRLLIVPLDGSTPHVIARGEEWLLVSCLAGNDRYAMVSYGSSTARWIGRIDVRTGEQVVWRKADDTSYNLSACPAEKDKVLYTSTYLSTPVLLAGNAEEIDPKKPDEPISSVNAAFSVYGYSEKADLLMMSTGAVPKKLIAFDANPETNSLLSTKTVLSERGSVPVWDPSGTRASWTSQSILHIWDRTSGETSSYDVDIHGGMYDHRWFPDGTKIGFWMGGGERSFSVLDLETGEVSGPIPGVRRGAIGPDGTSLIVPDDDAYDKCFVRVDLSTLERTPFYCLEGDNYWWPCRVFIRFGHRKFLCWPKVLNCHRSDLILSVSGSSAVWGYSTMPPVLSPRLPTHRFLCLNEIFQSIDFKVLG